MTAKITELTPEQRAAMKPWAEKWIKIGLSTEPADRERAEVAYRACYRYAELKDDVPVIWVNSPLVGAFAAAISRDVLGGKSAVDLAVRSEVESAVRSEVRSAVRLAVWSAVDSAVWSAVRLAVWSAVDSAVWSAVRLEVDSAVDSAVRSAVWSAVRSEVRSAVRLAVGLEVDLEVDSAVRSAVGSAVRSEVRSAVGSAVGLEVDLEVDSAVRSANLRWHYWLGGALWSAYPAYESFFRNVCGLELPRDLSVRASAYAECSEAAGHWWPNKNFIMACERPRAIKLDTEGRLHNEEGKAIEWPDGWGLYSWHGTTIPGEWIEDRESLTPKVALTWGNVEQRRVACEIIGWDRVLEEPGLNPRIIDADEPHIGTLIEVDLPDSPNQWFIKYRCGTGRWFAESVNDKRYNTALKANAGGNGWRGIGDPISFIPFTRT